MKYSENEILNRYRRAYEQPWGKSSLRFLLPFFTSVGFNRIHCGNNMPEVTTAGYYLSTTKIANGTNEASFMLLAN